MYSDRTPFIRPIEISCITHKKSICLNYCAQTNCCKLLCEECISQHLSYHKSHCMQTQLILSLKKVRQNCIYKCESIIKQLQMLSLKKQKNPKQIEQQAQQKLNSIAEQMINIVKEQINKHFQLIQKDLHKSFSEIKTFERINNELHQTINMFSNYRASIGEGTKQTPEFIGRVLLTNEDEQKEAIRKQIEQYNKKINDIDYDFYFNQNQFRNLVFQSVKINSYENSSNLSQIKTQKQKIKSVDTISKSFIPSNESFELEQQSEFKYLHFFETDSSFLHLINLTKPEKITQKIITLNNYTVPQFHSSIMINSNEIFISGGNNDQNKKSNKMAKCSLNTKSKETFFTKDFVQVKPRSSHTLCQVGNYIYILGGFRCSNKETNQEQETNVEKVDIKYRKVVIETKSKYGGMNIAFALQNQLIVKASQDGVEVYNTKERSWSEIDVPQNYGLANCCGWTLISDDKILIYGGYNEDRLGIDQCQSWRISQNVLQVQNKKYKLPVKAGFINNPGVIVGKKLYAIQSVINHCSENQDDQGDGIVESERQILCFNGYQWRLQDVYQRNAG